MNEKRIDEYIRYFNGKLTSILELKDSKEDIPPDYPDRSIIMFKKSLIVNLLDALSKIVYGECNKGSRKRFVTFLEKFGDWPDGPRLSTPHLNRALELDLEPRLGDLRRYVGERLENWEELMKDIYLDKDVSKEDVISHFPEGIKRKLYGIPLDSFNHYNLMYEARNSRVHELREKGYGIEAPGDQKPYYYLFDQLGTLGENVKSWQLVYPLEFLVELARRALRQLGEYLKQNDTNPDKHFRFGTYFIDKLNPEWI